MRRTRAPPIDDRYEILEVWRRPLRGDARRRRAGAGEGRGRRLRARGVRGRRQHAPGRPPRARCSTRPTCSPASRSPRPTGSRPCSRSAADRVEDAESLLFDLRVPVNLAWREVELASEVIEPGGLRSAPLVPWEPEAESTGAGALRDRHLHPRLRPPGRRAAAPGPRRGALLGGGRLGGPPGRARRAQPHAAALPRRQPRGGAAAHRGGPGQPRQAPRGRRPDDEARETGDRPARLGALAPARDAAALPAAAADAPARRREPAAHRAAADRLQPRLGGRPAGDDGRRAPAPHAR